VILMAISKRAKARFKIMTRSEKASVKKAVKHLYEAELIGIKRMMEIIRYCEK
jgi:ribosomal protein L23